MISVLTATGDLMFSGRVRERMAASRDPLWSLRRVRDALVAGDVLFGNFETPTSVLRQAEPGCTGRHFSPPGTARALKALGFDVVNLAHNHLYDFGAEGVECTLAEMADAGLAAVGVGLDERAARRPAIVHTRAGQRIGVLAYATAHTAVNSTHRYVACFPHPGKVTEDVAALRSQADVVVVSCHTGAQFNPYPAPETRTLARTAIRAGASVFLGHHPHVPQGCERIEDGLAVYSLGNFVASSRREDTRRTFFVRISLEGRRVVSYEVVPCYITDESQTILADEPLASDIRAHIAQLSEDIAQGRSDDLHFAHARRHLFSQYIATWIREFRRGGPRAILDKVRHFRPYHAQLAGRMLFGRRLGQKRPTPRDRS